jgi:hypothetical protein
MIEKEVTEFNCPSSYNVYIMPGLGQFTTWSMQLNRFKDSETPQQGAGF